MPLLTRIHAWLDALRVRRAVRVYCIDRSLDGFETAAACRLARVHWNLHGNRAAAVAAGQACAARLAQHHAPRPHRLAGVVVPHPTLRRTP